MDKIDEEELYCKFCSRIFNVIDRKPRVIFQCGDSICKDCLIRFMKSSMNSFVCPVDGQKINTENKSLKDFPENLALLEKIRLSLKIRINRKSEMSLPLFKKESEEDHISNIKVDFENFSPSPPRQIELDFNDSSNNKEDTEEFLYKKNPPIRKHLSSNFNKRSKGGLLPLNKELSPIPNFRDIKENDNRFEFVNSSLSKENKSIGSRKESLEQFYNNSREKLKKKNSTFSLRENSNLDFDKNNKVLLKKNSLFPQRDQLYQIPSIKNSKKTDSKCSFEKSNNMDSKNDMIIIDDDPHDLQDISIGKKNLVSDDEKEKLSLNGEKIEIENDTYFNLNFQNGDKCETHERDMELVCFTCKKLICYECVTFGAHKNHQRIIKIQEFLKETEIRSQKINQVLTNLVNEEDFVEKLFYQEEILPKLNTKKNDLQKTIEEIYQNAVFLLEEQKNQMLLVSEENFKEYEKKFEKTYDEKYMFKTDVKKCKKKIENLNSKIKDSLNPIKTAFLMEEELIKKNILEDGEDLMREFEDLKKFLKIKTDKYCDEIEIKRNIDLTSPLIEIKNPVSILDSNLFEINVGNPLFLETNHSNLMDKINIDEEDDLVMSLNENKPRVIRETKTSREQINLQKLSNFNPLVQKPETTSKQKFENMKNNYFNKNDEVVRPRENSMNLDVVFNNKFEGFLTQRSHHQIPLNFGKNHAKNGTFHNLDDLIKSERISNIVIKNKNNTSIDMQNNSKTKANSTNKNELPKIKIELNEADQNINKINLKKRNNINFMTNKKMNEKTTNFDQKNLNTNESRSRNTSFLKISNIDHENLQKEDGNKSKSRSIISRRKIKNIEPINERKPRELKIPQNLLSQTKNVNKKLVLEDLEKRDKEIKKMMTKLKNHNLQILNLNFKSLKDIHIFVLEPFLVDNKKLVEIHLKGNRIEDDGICLLSSILVNSNVSVLNLGWNKFTEKGAYFLADLCRMNRHIKKLNLKNNELISDKNQIKRIFNDIDVELEI
jgi:hypothetical protein